MTPPDTGVDPDAAPDFAPLRVLVVDDAPTVRLYHGELLRRIGFVVDEANNGYEALEMALVATFDLLLVDVNMPTMDGFELISRLRAPEVGVTCPIVTISTEAEEADAEAAYRSGANYYLVKPVAPPVLQQLAGVLTRPVGAAPAAATAGGLG